MPKGVLLTGEIEEQTVSNCTCELIMNQISFPVRSTSSNCHKHVEQCNRNTFHEEKFFRPIFFLPAKLPLPYSIPWATVLGTFVMKGQTSSSLKHICLGE
jgi:hypothetical protein